MDFTKAFRFDGDTLFILDQTRLPAAEEWVACTTWQDAAHAIRTLKVRGAPLIGVVAAHALALAIPRGEGSEEARKALAEAARALAAARPTAVNLAWALGEVLGSPGVTAAGSATALRRAVLDRAAELAREDEALGEAIGRHGAALLAGANGILTHCNTGSLATAGPGTALAAIIARHRQGGGVHVYVSETRPLFQGSRLTAYELAVAGVPYTIVAEGARAALLATGRVDAAIVGADRIALNGDAANKIGTYDLALAARWHDVPFYVAAPFSTFDAAAATGADIPIEERDPGELLAVGGARLAPADAGAWNPAFDVTPAALVTAYITERGAFRSPLPADIFRRGTDDGGA